MNNFVKYLDNLAVKFSIIGLSETWLTEYNYDLYNIDGYNSVHAYRSNRTGSGVSIMIKNDIIFTERHDIAVFNEYIECIFIELQRNITGLSKNVVIGLVYQPILINSMIPLVNYSLRSKMKRSFVV